MSSSAETSTTQKRGLPVYKRRRRRQLCAYGLSGGWIERVVACLADPQSMAGRDSLRAALECRGFTSV